MQTNSISILNCSPIYSEDNIKSIIFRINELHPRISSENVDQYLLDLFNVKSIEEIMGDFLVFEEVEPALSSIELHVFAERIIAYNDNDINKAIFSARNILNSIPKSIDDLIDYVTQERKNEFIEAVLGKSIAAAGESIESILTIDNLADAVSEEYSFVIDMICNDEMDRCRQIPNEDTPGNTERQKLLFNAGNYYLNHKIGFKCNSAWLACFVNSQVFGCAHGWLHHNGKICNDVHFGFKDDRSSLRLVLESLEYMDELLTSYEAEKKQEVAQTAMLYIQTLIFSLELLLKDNLLNGNDNTEDYERIKVVLYSHSRILSDEHLLMIVTLEIIQKAELEMSDNQLELMRKIIQDYTEKGTEPPEHLMFFFDAWNFFTFDVMNLNIYRLGPLFLRSRFYSESLIEMSDILLEQVKNNDLSEVYENMFLGFFDNFLHILVNENSDSHFLFDAIFEVSLKVNETINCEKIIRLMAELGHLKSMNYITDFSAGSNSEYWSKRVSLLK